MEHSKAHIDKLTGVCLMLTKFYQELANEQAYLDKSKLSDNQLAMIKNKLA